jgi:cytochrome c6
MPWLNAGAGVATAKSHGGKCKAMKMKSLVLVASLALANSAFAAADGAAVFKAKCAMCHGADGSASTGMGKSLGLKPLSSPEVQKMSDADLTGLVTNGKGKMPAYKGKLSDEEISAVVKYVKTLK